MNKLLKKIINTIYSEQFFCAEFAVNYVNPELLKKYHDVHWFCHELVRSHNIMGLQDIYGSGSNIKIVFDSKEIKPEDLVIKLAQLGLNISLLKIKPLFSLFEKKK